MIDRPKEPPKLDDEDDFGDAFPSERPTADGTQPDQRPTVSPPFDVEEFAKHSDSKLRAVRMPPQRSPSETPTGHPSELPTNIPPDLDFPLEFAPVDRVRTPQITLTDEHEMEEARLRSVLMQSDPPPKRESGRPTEQSERPTAAPDGGEPVEEAPKTRAYPSEYEKDPFAHLNAPTSSDGSASANASRPSTEMSDRFSLGDYTGALEIAESILAEDPANAKANKCADECKAKLIQMYTARIGPLDKVPMVMVAREQLRWLSIDHRAGFLLSHVDGVSNLEMILDVSGMPLLDALKILAELQQQRVISFR